jgi:hypothetical protein
VSGWGSRRAALDLEALRRCLQQLCSKHSCVLPASPPSIGVAASASATPPRRTASTQGSRAQREKGQEEGKGQEEEEWGVEEEVKLPPCKLVVVEGLFALHPALSRAVDVKVHCTGGVQAALLRGAERAVRHVIGWPWAVIICTAVH